jgi:hypothetical protein
MKGEIDTIFMRKKRVLIYPALAGLVAVSQWIATAPACPSAREWTVCLVGAALAAGNALKAYLDNSGLQSPPKP